MQPTHYEITVRGRLTGTLAAAFDGMRARRLARHTVLFGEVPDQAALFGLLDRVQSLGLELVEVRRVAVAG